MKGKQAKTKLLRMEFVMSEVINFIKKALMKSDTAPIFKLNELKEMFCTTFQRYTGNEIDLHSTRFKEEILSCISGLKAHKQGKHIILTSEDVATDALLMAVKNSEDEDGMFLVKAAKRVRRDIFNQINENDCFDGKFDKESQLNSVPTSLIMLVQMLLEGANISLTTDNKTKDIALVIAQLIKFNSVKKRRDSNVLHFRHKPSQETAVPVYLALMLHAETRKKRLIEKMASMGLCISYNRVDEIQSLVTKNICNEYDHKQLVRPSILVSGNFTTSAIDNIDHNSTSSTSKTHFHGTSISLFQHNEIDDQPPQATVYDMSSQQQMKESGIELPLYYTDVAPLPPLKSQVPISKTNTCSRTVVHNPFNKSLDWLMFVDDVNCGIKHTLPSNWSSYYQETSESAPSAPTTSVLLPLINENINSAAMVKHCMEVIRKTVNDVNPNQIPVITADQPVYTLMKQVQWKYTCTFGEDQFVVMMGGLHLEMVMLAVLGLGL